MSDNLVVRVAGPDDVRSISILNGIVQTAHHEAHPNRFLAADPDRVQPVLETWLRDGATHLGAGRTRAWLCEIDAEPVGYVIAVLCEQSETPFHRPRRWIELDQIAIRADARRLGVGKALASEVAEWARDAHVSRLELSVWSFNEAAQSFFAALGFTAIQTRMVSEAPHGHRPG
jgi:diamine N-acetyltransferase